MTEFQFKVCKTMQNCRITLEAFAESVKVSEDLMLRAWQANNYEDFLNMGKNPDEITNLFGKMFGYESQK